MFGLSIGWLVAVVLGGVLVGKLVKRTDDKIEERRDNALEVSKVLDDLGLDVLSEVTRAYAVGNYSKIAKAGRKAVITLNNPAATQDLFDRVYTKLHNAKLAKAAEAAKVAPIAAPAKPVASA